MSMHTYVKRVYKNKMTKVRKKPHLLSTVFIMEDMIHRVKQVRLFSSLGHWSDACWSTIKLQPV